MANATEFAEIALSFEGTVEQPHFDRRAYKARVIFASLAPDGLTANIKFSPDEQEFRCAAQHEAYRRIPNKWGAQGWTTAVLSALSCDELRAALAGAWREAAAKPRATRRRR